MDDNVLARLRQFIVAHYDLEDLRTLCFDLGVAYDDLRGEGCSAKARELTVWMGRRRQFDRLLTTLRRDHPDLFEQTGLSAHLDSLESLYDELPPFVLEAPEKRGCYAQLGPLKLAMVLSALLTAGLVGLVLLSNRMAEVFEEIVAALGF
jgi:hypothetical protein